MMLNFVSNFANVTDAEIYFSEIEIRNAYSTQENMQRTMMKHYVKQGLQQFYQILGSTDIIGNPAGLINNLGRGVELLYNEPYQGILAGNAKDAAKGIGRGIKGLLANTTVGVSNSV